MTRKRALLVLALFCFFVSIESFAAEQKARKQILKLMGSRFEITAIHNDEEVADKAVRLGIAEIARIEALISSWDPQSQTSEIVRQAGIKPVVVDKELFDLIERALKVSRLTQGIFDISYASMDKIWKYDGSMTKLPTDEERLASISKIGYKRIILNREELSVYLTEKGMKIGFGAIGKGYAADRAKTVMQEAGIKNGLVNAGGDLTAWGRQENGKDWGIGITDPRDNTRTFSWLRISDSAVVTSGNYERFVEIDGKTYGHIINPTTGWPASGIRSVTVICPSAELADALATSVFILGEKEGLKLINSLNGIECLVVNSQDEIITSDNMELNFQNAQAQND